MSNRRPALGGVRQGKSTSQLLLVEGLLAE